MRIILPTIVSHVFTCYPFSVGSSVCAYLVCSVKTEKQILTPHSRTCPLRSMLFSTPSSELRFIETCTHTDRHILTPHHLPSPRLFHFRLPRRLDVRLRDTYTLAMDLALRLAWGRLVSIRLPWTLEEQLPR